MNKTDARRYLLLQNRLSNYYAQIELIQKEMRELLGKVGE
jgi:hypothetical protein